MPDTQEHAFAQYIRALGKGKQGSRSLSFDEASAAMQMILAGDVEPVQLGAFLMLLRVKEESAAEIAGFVHACRQAIAPPLPTMPAVAFDWSSYAGKRRQPHWFLLAALLLAQNGHAVFMHGARGHTAGRVYTEDMCRALQLPVASSWSDVATQLNQHNFSFMPIAQLCQPLHELIQLRPLFGLRSPVHTLCRLLNPLAAHCTLQSVFHPAYADTHHGAAQQLGESNAAVFKGDAGEVEYRPQARVKLHILRNGESIQHTTNRLGEAPQPLTPNAKHLLDVWRGHSENTYAEQAITGTAAIALYTSAHAESMDAAMQAAQTMWRQREELLGS
ncbi:MAG: glycosyl transferase family protein [Pseudomonadales bacterium]|nr:glycosyl transferase family protein [Pseudomonadales bacterium]